MKRIKQVDLVLQALLLVLTPVIFLLYRAWPGAGYLMLAGWQLTGMVYHQVNGIYTGRRMPRHFYHRVVLLIVSMLLVTSFFPFLHFVHYAIRFAAPFLSVLYGYICYKETFRYMVRPLELV